MNDNHGTWPNRAKDAIDTEYDCFELCIIDHHNFDDLSMGTNLGRGPSDARAGRPKFV
jgi:hypothetical protein